MRPQKYGDILMNGDEYNEIDEYIDLDEFMDSFIYENHMNEVKNDDDVE